MDRTPKRGPWLFLAVVILIYGVIVVLDPDTARRASITAWSMLQRLAPVLVLVFILMFVIERFLSRENTVRWLGRESGWRGWLIAPVVGVLSTGPVYSWYALLGDLKDKGMRTALVAALLYARAVKLPLLPLMVHYFGARYTLLLSLLILAFSVINGLAMERLMRSADRR